MSNPFLWRHLYSGHAATVFTTYTRRSLASTIPLTIVIDESPGSLKGVALLLHDFIQELHIVDIDRRTVDLLTPLRQTHWPKLEFFSLTKSAGDWDDGPVFPLSPENTPQLRYLHLKHITVLGTQGLPQLTHISLSNLHLAQCHSKLATFLSSCPNLVNVTLDRLNNPALAPIPPIDLPRLRRVILHDMSTRAVQFYLALLRCDREDMAVQVLSRDVPMRRFPLEHLLPRYIPGRPSAIEIASHDYVAAVSNTDTCDYFDLSVTAAGLKNALRFSRDFHTLGEQLPRFFRHSSAYSHVRDVWIVNVPGTVSRHVWDNIATVLAGFTSLETVTVVCDYTRFFDARTNLSLLPKFSDPSFSCSRFKTLRLVHWLTKTISNIPSVAFIRIPLRKMLSQLQSGEYAYIENLTLQHTIHFDLDSNEIEDLKEYIPNVRRELIEALPTMPLPDHCVEPARGPAVTFSTSMW